MNLNRTLVATVAGAAAVGGLALPATSASADTGSGAAVANHRDGDRRDGDRRGFEGRDFDQRAWQRNDRNRGRNTVSFWRIVRADDADGRNAVNLREGQWAKVQVVRALTDCNSNDDSDACVFGRNGSDAAAPAGWLAPGLRQFSLVATVGDGKPVQLGEDKTKLTGPGQVTLAYNDLLGTYDDNRGGFLVKIKKCFRNC